MWLDSVTSFSYKFAFVLQVFQLSFLLQVVKNNATTEYDLTEKTITPRVTIWVPRTVPLLFSARYSIYLC